MVGYDNFTLYELERLRDFLKGEYSKENITFALSTKGKIVVSISKSNNKLTIKEVINRAKYFTDIEFSKTLSEELFRIRLITDIK